MDEKLKQLAANILTKSIKLQPGEKIYLEGVGRKTLPLLTALVEKAGEMGAVPFYFFNEPRLTNALLKHSSENQIAGFAEYHAGLMKQMDAWVGLRSFDNPCDDADSTPEARKWYQQHFVQGVQFGIRLKQTRWCLLRCPTEVMAYNAGMSTEQFEEFYYRACLIDYSKMAEAMQPLQKLMERTDKVKIVAPDTELTFSIKGVGACACSGRQNIPDGEVFTVPVRETVNGTVRFNTLTKQNGRMFSNICLEVKDGKIFNAFHDGAARDLIDVLETDDGSRYFGEFALGVNPFIKKPMADTLFDEKISGSFHLAIGNQLEQTPNGNRSGIHWDLVQIQTPEYGGGSIFFDDKLVRLDGRFVLPELEGLNPENLEKL